MAQRGMAYDHPAYRAVLPVGGAPLTGSGGSLRFAAFADMIARSVTLKPATAGTSADTVTVFAVTGTTTRTLGVTTVTSAQTAGTRLELTTGSNVLTELDELRVTKGTDATVVYAVGMELTIRPGANVTGNDQ